MMIQGIQGSMTRRSRIIGSLLGEAVGDALGYPVEFDKTITPRQPIVDQLTLGYGEQVAPYSDDTQMTIAVVEGMLAVGEGSSFLFQAATKSVADKFVAWSVNPEGGHRAPGGTCLEGCRRLAMGVPPLEAGRGEPHGGGCGAVMRSAPYGWFFRDVQLAAKWAALHAQLTHNSRIGRASSAALAAAVATALDNSNPYQIADAAYEAAKDRCHHTASMIGHAIYTATRGDNGLDQDCMILDRYRGWAGHEAIAASLYCFLCHSASYKEAVLLAVNSPGDSDSLGAITGAISGAYLGVEAIPAEWIEIIENRERLLALGGLVSDRLVVRGTDVYTEGVRG